MARIDSHNPPYLPPLRDFPPTSPETASPAELAEALIQITLHCPSAFDATLRACAKQLQAGIAALFNGVKP